MTGRRMVARKFKADTLHDSGFGLAGVLHYRHLVFWKADLIVLTLDSIYTTSGKALQ